MNKTRKKQGFTPTPVKRGGKPTDELSGTRKILPQSRQHKSLVWGFTLVELLVVLTIIGILAIVVMASLTDAQARSRDSKRVSEIRSLQEGLAMYLDNHSTFPLQTTAVVLNGGPSDNVESALKTENILKSNIIDPLDGQIINGFVFHYWYVTDATGKTYTITYCQETTAMQGQTKNCSNTVSQSH